MDKKLKDLIEDQINKELWSAYIYYDMAEFYRARGLDGFHHYFEKQAHEEYEHAEKFAEYLQDLGVAFEMKPIAAPGYKYHDFRDPLVTQLEHEKLVTSLIEKIYAESVALKDYKTTAFLTWYINEQFEEEKIAKDLLDKFDLFAKDDKAMLYKLDKELGERK